MDGSERSGQSLVEIMIAIALGALFVIAAASAVVPALQTTKQVASVQTRAALAAELLNNLRAWAAGDWHNVLNLATTSANPYYLIASSSPFAATSGVESVTVGTTTYVRSFYLGDLYRDPGGNVTTTSSGNSYDPSTKQITLVFGVLGGSTSSIATYVSRNQNSAFRQANWSGGPGAGGPVTTVGSGFTSATNNVLYASPPGSLTLQATAGSGPSSGYSAQETVVSNDAATTSSVAVFPVNTTAGNLIILGVSWGGLVSDQPSSVTDALGNVYALATTTADTGHVQAIAVYYAQNIAGGANAVTVAWPTGRNFTAILAHEYSGVLTTGAFDVASANFQIGSPSGVNAVTSGAAATASSSELIFGVTEATDGSQPTISAGTGYTTRLIAQNDKVLSEDMLQTFAGPIAATFTNSPAASTTVSIMATFRTRP